MEDFSAGRPGTSRSGQAEDVDHVIAGAGELGLSEQREQAVVAAVAVDDDDLLAAVARHLAHRLLQQGELRRQAVGDGSGLLARLEDLAEVVLGKHDGVLLLDRVHHREAHVEQVGAQRQMGAMLFDDAERQHAHALRLMDCLDEVRAGQFFPFGGKAGLREADTRSRRRDGHSNRKSVLKIHRETSGPALKQAMIASNARRRHWNLANEARTSRRRPSH